MDNNNVDGVTWPGQQGAPGQAPPMDNQQGGYPQQPPMQQGYPAQQPMQQGYPQQQGYPMQGGYPQQQPMQQGYPMQQGGYPQQQPYPQQGMAMAPAGAKQSTVAGLLGIFLGAWGGHDWYLGNKKEATIHVILGGGGLVLGIVGLIISKGFSIFDLMTISSVTSAFRSWGIGNIGAQYWIGAIVSIIGWLAMAGSFVWGLIGGIQCLSKSGKYGRDASGMPLV